MSRFLVIVFVVACGAGAKQAAPPAGGPASSSSPSGAACDPGRCLDDISRSIEAHRAEIDACYAKARKAHPGVSGRVVINFEIEPGGSVVDLSQGMQDNQLQDADLVTCLSGVIAMVTFPKSAAGKKTRAYHRFELGR